MQPPHCSRCHFGREERRACCCHSPQPRRQRRGGLTDGARREQRLLLWHLANRSRCAPSRGAGSLGRLSVLGRNSPRAPRCSLTRMSTRRWCRRNVMVGEFTSNAIDIDRARSSRLLASDEAELRACAGHDALEWCGAADGIAGNRDSDLERFRCTDLYRDVTGAAQAELAGMHETAKPRMTRSVLDRMEDGALISPSGVEAAIDGVLPATGNPGYL